MQRVVWGIFLTEQAADDLGGQNMVYRIVWSKDGTRFFAIGNDSNCLPGIRFPDVKAGAYALVMYDGAFHRLCRAESSDELKKYEWHDFSF